MRYYFTRIALTILTLFYSSLNVLAAPEDHGRSYSLDDSDSGGFSSMSPTSVIIRAIIGIILVSLMIIIIANEDDRSTSDKGCGIILGVIVIAFFVICLMSKCGG